MLRLLPTNCARLFTFIAITVVEFIAGHATAQVNLTNASPSYTQNFDAGLGTGSGTWTDNGTIAGWYTNKTAYTAGTGSGATGALYNFGAAGASDRCLGSVGSSGNAYVWAVKVKNNGTTNITSLNVSYTGEQWRNGGGTGLAQTVSFAYSTTAGATISSGTYTNLTALDFTSPIFSASAAALDGNASANRITNISSAISVTLAPGAEIWLRWTDIDHPSNDHGLGIDDFSVTATFVSANTTPAFVTASPQTLSAVCIGGGAVSLNSALRVNDADASQTETWTVTTAPTKGTLSGFPATAASGSTSIAPGGTLTYTPSTAGADQFIIRVSDGTATASMTVNITNNAPATANAGTTLNVCSASPVTLAGTKGGSAASSTWSAPSGTFSDVTSLTSTYTPNIASGSVTLTLTTDDPTGPCAAVTSTVSVTVNPLPSPTIDGTTTIPTGGSAVLTFSGDVGDVVFYTDGTTPASTTIGASGTSTVSVSPAGNTTYTITSATSALSCSRVITGETAIVTVSSAPTANINGSTDICVGASAQLYFSGTAGGVVTYTDGTTPATVTLSGSSGIGTATVTVMPVTSTTYTLQSISSGGIYALSGSATINVTSYPVAYTVTGSGSYCTGGAGVALGLSNSETGVDYQLYDASGSVGSPVAGGTGSPISFGSITIAGTYSVSAINSTGCSVTMLGDATVSINSLPTAYAVSGGGTGCAATGVAIGLANSETGVNYQLYRGATLIGSGIPGTSGAPIAFANQSTAGTYTVLATDAGTGCRRVMSGTAVVTITPLPAAGAIVGATSVIIGNTTALTNLTSGGTWTSINTLVATINSGTGVVTGIVPGTSAIVYTITNACGTATTSVTMNVTNTPATVNWNFTDVNATADNSTSANVNAANCAASIGGSWGTVSTPISTTSASSGYTGATGGGNIGNAVNNTSASYIQFEVEPNAGYSLNITGISLASRSTGSGTTLLNITSSVDNYTTVLASQTVAANSSYAFYSFSGFSGVSLATSTPIIIRVYGINGTAAAGSGTINWRLDDITVSYVASCINPAAQTVTGGGTICAGSAGIAVNLAASESGVNYQLYRGSTAVGSVVAGTGAGVLAMGLQTTAGTYSVSAARSTCASNMTGSATVTVNPVATANAGGNETVCTDGSVTLSGSVGGGAATGIWSAASGAFSDVNSMTASFTPSILSGSVVLTLTTNDPTGPCPAAVSTMTVTVNEVATATAGANQAVCAGNTITLASSIGGSATAGTWTAASGAFSDINSGTATYTPSITSGDVVLTFTTNDPTGPCPAAVSTMTVTVNEIATATAGANQAVCAGNTITLAGSIGGNATAGTWTAASGSFSDINSGTSTYTPSVTSGDVVLTFTTNDPAGPCPVAVSTMTVTVNELATATAGANQAVCAGNTITLAGSIGGSATAGTWTAASGSFSDINSGTSTYTPSITSGDVVLTFTTNDPTGPCPAAVSTMTVTVNEIATVTAGANQAVCAGNTITLAGSFSGSATAGTWTAASGSFSDINSGTSTYTPSVTSGDVVLTFTTNDPTGPCPAAVSTMTVTVNELATATAGANQAVCAGNTITLAGSISGSATAGTWTAASGSFSDINSGTSTYTPSITSGDVVLTFTTNDPTGPCPAVVSTMTVTVNEIATVTAGANQAVCAGNTITLAGSIGGSATAGTWTAASGSFSDINSGTSTYTPSITSGDVVLTFTTNDPTGPCPAAVSTMTVTVNEIATATAGANQAVCAGNTITLAGSFSGSATAGTWTAAWGAFSDINSGTATYTPSVTSGDVVLAFTTNDPTGPCPAAVSTMTVTVNEVATATAGANQAVCAGNTITLAGSFSGSATAGTWTAASGAFSDINSGTATYTPSITSGDVVLTFTTNDPTGPCPAAVSTMTVTVNEVATATAGANQAVCAGNAITLAGWIGGSATAGTWTAASGSFSDINSGTSTYTPSVMSGDVELTFTTNDPTGPCPAAVSTMTVTVNEVATATAGANQAVCAGNAITLAGWIGGSATAGTWTAASGSFSDINSGTSTYTPSVMSGDVELTFTTNDPTGPCPAAASTMTVTVNEVATATAGANQAVCAGNTITLAGSISGSATAGTWTAASGSFSDVNSGTATYTPSITSGDVVLTFTTNDPTGPCPAAVSTMTVTVNEIATATAGVNQAVCARNTITLAGSIGGSATAGTWTTASGSFSDINSGTSIYTPSVPSGDVVLTFTTNDPTGPCPAAVSTMTVTVNEIATATAGVNQAVCAGNTITLAGSTGGSATAGTWTAASGSFSDINSGTSIYTPSVPSGDVVLTFTTNDPTGPCPAAASTMTVTINPAAAASAGTNQTVCAGNTITLAGTVSGGATTGTWTATSGFFSNINSMSAVYSPSITSGSVVLTLTSDDPTGPCPAAVSTMTVTVQPLTIVGAGNVCVGASISLSNIVAGGTWSTASTSIATVSSTGVVIGIASGSAEIIYSTGVGCSASATVAVIANPASIDGITALCAGSILQLSNATPGGTWTSSSTTIATVNTGTGLVASISGGTTIITYFAGGCAATASVAVDAVSPIIGNTGVCAGPITLSNSTGGGTWSSSNTIVATIDANGVVTGVSSGRTVISYMPLVGCVATATVNVGTPSSITGQMNVCPGAVTTLSNATAGGIWISGNNSIATVDAAGNVYGVATGTVNITYTIGSGCFTAANLTVIAGPGPITGAVTVCEGIAVNLYNNVSGGMWSTSSPIATISTGGVLTGNSGGSAVVTYTLLSGCMSIRAVVINSASPITGGTVVCVGQETALNNDLGGGVWSSGNGSLARITTAGVVTGVGAGNVVIYYIWPNGCQKTAVVTVHPLMQTTGGATVCQNQSIALGNSTAGTGVWSSGNTAVGTVSSAGVLTGLGAGVVAISYTTNMGCVYIKTVNVNPAATVTGNMNVCAGQTTALSASIAGGAWVSNSSVVAGVSATGIITGNVAGQAIICYVLPTGCQATTSITVSDLRAIMGSTSVCAGAATQLYNTTAGGGMWSSDNTTVANINAATGALLAGLPGSAVISFSAASGCVATKTVTINPSAIVNAGTNQVICAGGTVAMSGSLTGAASAQWSAPSGTFGNANALNTTYTPSVSSGTVILTLTTTAGSGICASATGTVAVTVNSSPVITGNTSICSGTTTLATSIAGGTWSSSNTSVASISTAGVVTAGVVGSAIISYASSNGCVRSVTVNIGSPASITGNTSVCTGTTVSLSNSVAGGTWRSSNASVARVGINTGVVSGVTAGVANITYALNSVCYTVTTVTVSAMPAAVGGMAAICAGSSVSLTNTVPGGIWSSSNSSVATVTTSGSVTGVANGIVAISYATAPACYQVKNVTINPSAPISGITAVCAGQTTSLTNTIAGGTWISGTSSYATVTAAGVVTGVIGGNVSIYYLLPTGCQRVATVTVNALSQIAGASSACSNKTIALSNATTGSGAWSSTNTTVATVNSTGLVTGIGSGSTTISFTAANGCVATKLVTMNGAAPITGNITVCVGQVTNVSTTSAGGNWSTSSGSLATVSALGVIGGVSTGSPRVSYIQTNGCQSVATVTVNALSSITGGTPGMCQSGVMALSNATPGGGVWTSGNTTVATVSPAGSVRGTGIGQVSIMFTTTLGCVATRSVTLNACREADTTETTSISTPALVNDVRLFPNPNMGLFILKGTVATDAESEVGIEVVNMLGQVIYRRTAAVRSGIIDERIQLQGNLTNGMYLLNLRTANGNMLFHFVVEQ